MHSKIGKLVPIFFLASKYTTNLNNQQNRYLNHLPNKIYFRLTDSTEYLWISNLELTENKYKRNFKPFFASQTH